MTEVLFEDSAYGTRAVAVGPLSEAAIRSIAQKGCEELELNQGKGWSGNDLRFLFDLPWIKVLRVIDLRLSSIDGIQALSKLEALDLSTYCKDAVDVTNFSGLQSCELEWFVGASSVLQCASLRRLFINRYDGLDFTQFAHLTALESLGILNAPVRTLEGIESLRELRALRLGNLKKLTSLAGIDALLKLEELHLQSCKKVGSIEHVAALASLKRLLLNDMGEIQSLKPIDSLKSIEDVLFYESTNIVDGDISPLVRQRNLKRVRFQNRSHYSHRRECFPHPIT